MYMAFKLGDVVTIKSGSPDMTVVHVNEKNISAVYFNTKDNVVEEISLPGSAFDKKSDKDIVYNQDVYKYIEDNVIKKVEDSFNKPIIDGKYSFSDIFKKVKESLVDIEKDKKASTKKD